MILFLIVKIIVVLFFLVMFLRRPGYVWGVGLLSVTTAVLLDTVLGTFGRNEMQAELGFFFYVISGGILGGTAVWAWGLLRPLVEPMPAPTSAAVPYTAVAPPPPDPVPSSPNDIVADMSVDRQMLHDQIRTRLGRSDILDLMFDLNINENEVMTLNQNMDQLILNIMNLAESRQQTPELALAVERTLTPLPPENLPRLEKLHVDSPPTVLRQYLIAHYDNTQLDGMAEQMGIDWEGLGGGGKREMVRNLLLYLYRRNRLDELLDLMQPATSASEPE